MSDRPDDGGAAGRRIEEAMAVLVSAFPDRSALRKHLRDVAWETEVWVAETPSHLIHFNGELGLSVR